MLNYQLPITIWSQFNEDEIGQALAEIHDAKVRLDVELMHAVARARALGLSWDAIGGPLNMTRQSAWQQWHYFDGAESRRRRASGPR